ncbi:MAG TPA: hypothetical protein VFR46_09670 [Actinomycetes bacterium]|nr:hypothetical protein [Actinomycetes bacterium]
MDRLLVVGCTVVAIVGLADATISREADLAAVFATLLLLLVLLLARLQLGRPAVGLRRDVVAWLRAQNRSTGEPIDQIASRAVAAYRVQLANGSDGRHIDRRSEDPA